MVSPIKKQDRPEQASPQQPITPTNPRFRTNFLSKTPSITTNTNDPSSSDTTPTPKPNVTAPKRSPEIKNLFDLNSQPATPRRNFQHNFKKPQLFRTPDKTFITSPNTKLSETSSASPDFLLTPTPLSNIPRFAKPDADADADVDGEEDADEDSIDGETSPIKRRPLTLRENHKRGSRNIHSNNQHPQERRQRQQDQDQTQQEPIKFFKTIAAELIHRAATHTNSTTLHQNHVPHQPENHPAVASTIAATTNEPEPKEPKARYYTHPDIASLVSSLRQTYSPTSLDTLDRSLQLHGGASAYEYHNLRAKAEAELFLGLGGALVPNDLLSGIRFFSSAAAAAAVRGRDMPGVAAGAGPGVGAGDEVNVFYIMDAVIGYIPVSIVVVLLPSHLPTSSSSTPSSLGKGGNAGGGNTQVAFFSSTDKDAVYETLYYSDAYEVGTDGPLYFNNGTVGMGVEKGKQVEMETAKEKEKEKITKRMEMMDRRVRKVVKALVDVIIAPGDSLRSGVFYPRGGTGAQMTENRGDEKKRARAKSGVRRGRPNKKRSGNWGRKGRVERKDSDDDSDGDVE